MNRRRRDPEPFGIVLIHGAAVVMEGCALIFLGPSGTGKSTISKILEPSAPVIGDDRLYLVPKDHNWYVADATIRSWKGALKEKEARDLISVPLGAVFRLFQSPRPQIARVDARRTCCYLSLAFYELRSWARYLDIQDQKAIFYNIADISRKTPGFDLHFQRSLEILAEIRRAVGIPSPMK